MLRIRNLQIIALVATFLGAATTVEAQTTSRVRGGYEVEIEHTFTVDAGESLLEIDRYSGDVELIWSANRQVVVTEVVHVDADSEEDAREQGVRSFSEVEEARGGLRIRGRNTYGDYKSIHVELASGMQAVVSTTNGDISVFSADAEIELASGNGDITVVRSAAGVEVRSGNGDIAVSDVEGSVEVANGAGDVTMTDVGRSAVVQTGAGDILAVRVNGNVTVQTGGGDIGVEQIGGDIELRTAGGDVEANTVSGSAELSTNGGSIDLVDIEGDLYATTMGGDIDGTSVQGVISAETMAGDIEFSGVVSEIMITTEVGDIQVEVSDADFLQDGSVRLRAGYGDVDLFLPPTTDANVSIELGFDGEFDPSDSPRSLRLNNMTQDVRQGRVRSVKGVLNSGGGRIEIKTGFGDVTIDAL